LGRGKTGFNGWGVGIDRCARMRGYRWKIENRAAGDRFSRTKRGGARIWLEGIQLGRGKMGFNGWEVGIDRCARVSGYGWKIENRAVGARFSRTIRSGARIWLEGTQLGRGKPGFKGWEVGIDHCTRVGGFGRKIENELVGLGFCERNAGEVGFG
jgi:hypothetical protein